MSLWAAPKSLCEIYCPIMHAEQEKEPIMQIPVLLIYIYRRPLYLDLWKRIFLLIGMHPSNKIGEIPKEEPHFASPTHFI